MREWLLLAVVFAPLAALCVVQQRGEDPPDWAVAIALAWFRLVGAAIGWYQGWFKRLFVAILVFIPIMIAIAWLAGGEGTATWPTWLNLLLIAGPIGVLVVLGTWTGWFTDAARSIKEMVAKHPPACEKCLTARKDLVWFEASAGMAEQRRRSLCPECVWNEIERQLSGWINPVLVLSQCATPMATTA
jgi:hypothetical protein